MFTDPQPLSKKNDRNLRILPREDFAFCRNEVSAMLGLSEVIPCSREMPVLFNQLGEDFYPVALLGTPATGNMLLENGKWSGTYIPAVFRAYPFLLMQVNNEEKSLTIGADKGSALLSTEEGEPLFAEDGEPSELLRNAGEMLTAIQGDQQRGALLGKLLKDKNLLSPFTVTATPRDENLKPRSFSFASLFFVEEKKLNELSNEDFLFLKEQNVLNFLYAHIFSLGRIDRVFSIQNHTESVPQ